MGATKVVLAYINGMYAVEYLSDSERVQGESLPRDAGLAAIDCLLSMAGLPPGGADEELNGNFVLSACGGQYDVFVSCPLAEQHPQVILELGPSAD